MKSGWKVTPLSTLCSVRRDSGIHRDMAYIGMEHIEAGTGRLLSLSNTDYVIGVTNSFRSGDLLYGKLRPYLKKVLVAETSGCCSTEILPITCKSDLIPEFLKYWFLEDTITERINATCGGCRMPRANMNDVFQFDFAYPCVEEQQRIVEVLDAEFAKIDALKANAEKNLQNAKDLFQASLKKELEPKDGWRRMSLQEACTQYGEYGMSLPSRAFDGIRYVRITDITEWGEMNDDKVSADTDVVEDKYLLSNGDILFARTGATVGKTLVYNEAMGPCSYAGYLIRYRPNLSIVLPRVLYYITHSKKYYDWVASTQKASTLPNISAKLYNAYEITIPTSLAEQSELVERLDILLEKCKALQENYNKTIALCDDLKQALLRKAFNGEL